MFLCFRVALVLAIFGIVLTVHQKPAVAQANSHKSVPVDWRVERQALEFQLGQDLVKISDWCNKNGLNRKVQATHELKLNRDLNRQYLFLPVAESMPDPNQAGELKEWQEKINAVKVAHAGRIFELAQRALNQDAHAVAYQLLYEVAYHDRDHAKARRILGHKSKNGAWDVEPKIFKARPSSKKHEYLALDKGQFQFIETAHFKIETTASEERTRRLAIQLELWHTVWRQIFFDYWGSKISLTKGFNGEQVVRLPKRKFQVFFFQNRQQYAELLTPWVPGIGGSSGYYSNDLKTSFFFDGDESAEETWRHELTHQLFRESKGRSPKDAFKKNFIWLDEGVATYTESMVQFDNYVTLGGFEAPRTQYARHQAMLERTALQAAHLNAMSQLDWQSRGDPRLYSQSAAIVDMLMNSNHGLHQDDLINLLKIIYRKQAKPSSFSKMTKLSFEQVDQQFLQFLKIENDMISKYMSKPETRTYLILTDAKLTANDYFALGKCVNLETLDLTGHVLKAQDLQPLANCPALNQLVLARCQFEPNSLLTLSKLPGLTRLNLTGSLIGQTQANEIAQLKQLKPGLIVIP